MSRAESVLVTGAAGFIGSTLVDQLLEEGRSVVGLDNFDPFYPEEEKLRNLAGATSSGDFRLVRGDIRDAKLVDELMGETRFDSVVHLAALAGVRPSLERPVAYADVNVNGTSVLLDAAVRHGKPRFVFASSSSVYGERESGPFLETDRVDLPISPYAATKKAGELVSHTFHSAHGLEVTCVRFFTAYGPRQRPDLAIRRFSERMRRGEPIPIFGDGSAIRDFTFVADVADGLVRAADTPLGYAILNFGAGRAITVLEMIEHLERALGVEAQKDFQDPQVGDVPRTLADVSAAQKAIGYQPRVTFEQGIERFVAWLDEQS
jgi:UDP-glucuronate 4-epimerase